MVHIIVLCGSGSVVERCLAKANVASSNLVFRSIMVPSPSGKAKVCKTFIPRFKSGWYLQKACVNTLFILGCPWHLLYSSKSKNAVCEGLWPTLWGPRKCLSFLGKRSKQVIRRYFSNLFENEQERSLRRAGVAEW